MGHIRFLNFTLHALLCNFLFCKNIASKQEACTFPIQFKGPAFSKALASPFVYDFIVSMLIQQTWCNLLWWGIWLLSLWDFVDFDCVTVIAKGVCPGTFSSFEHLQWAFLYLFNAVIRWFLKRMSFFMQCFFKGEFFPHNFSSRNPNEF